MPSRDDDAFWGQVLCSWWMIQKSPVKEYYFVKPILYKSFDIEITAWTPIQSRYPVIQRYNQNTMVGKVLAWPLAADVIHLCKWVKFVGQNCWAMFALTDFTALAREEVKMHSHTGKCIHSVIHPDRMICSHSANRIGAVVKTWIFSSVTTMNIFKQKLPRQDIY